MNERAHAMRLIGCDFTSAPRAAKPIVVAFGRLEERDVVRLDGFERFTTLDAWGRWLAAPPAHLQSWVGAFDFPFGLPRALVVQLDWPTDWRDCIRHYAQLSRAEIRATFAAFCAARPAGGKFAHRATDAPAGSSTSMKWVNPPVAFMLHAALPPLLEADVLLPGLCDRGDPRRVALEGYPGLLAREILGRQSYKADDRPRQTAERRAARERLVGALEHGATRLALRLALAGPERERAVGDPSGDHLDAALCLMQAGWALARRRDGDARWGLPEAVDPLEGWIVTASMDAAAPMRPLARSASAAR